MEIAIPLFDRFTALDAVGPYQVLSNLPGARVRFLGPEAGVLTSDDGMLGLLAEGRWEDASSPAIVVVPGGIGSRTMLQDARLLAWLRAVHQTSDWTTSVCTGSLILAAAGILDGLEATTHWAAMERLESLGARPVRRRVVEQGKVLTAAGVSAGIDMALRLAELVAGVEVAQGIQLAIEYDPQPPFDAGSPGKAPTAIVQAARRAEQAQEVRSLSSP